MAIIGQPPGPTIGQAGDAGPLDLQEKSVNGIRPRQHLGLAGEGAGADSPAIMIGPQIPIDDPASDAAARPIGLPAAQIGHDQIIGTGVKGGAIGGVGFVADVDLRLEIAREQAIRAAVLRQLIGPEIAFEKSAGGGRVIRHLGNRGAGRAPSGVTAGKFRRRQPRRPRDPAIIAAADGQGGQRATRIGGRPAG